VAVVSEALRSWAGANPIAARQRVADILGTSLYYVTQTASDVLAQYIADHDPGFVPAVEAAPNLGPVEAPPPPPPAPAPVPAPTIAPPAGQVSTIKPAVAPSTPPQLAGSPVAPEPRVFDPYGQPKAPSGAPPAPVQDQPARTATATPALAPVQAPITLTPAQQQEKDYLDRFNAGAAAQGGGTLDANFSAVANPNDPGGVFAQTGDYKAWVDAQERVAQDAPAKEGA